MSANWTSPLTTALPRFLRRCDAESTRAAYERELLRFISWAEDAAGPEILFDYRDHLRERGLSPTSVRWRTTVVRAFLLFAEGHGYLGQGAVGDFKPPRGKSGFAPRVLTSGELKRLLEAPDRRSRRGRRDAAVLVCLGVGGLRAGEVCRLDVQDLRLLGDRAVLRVNGKGRRQRLVELPRSAAGILSAYLSGWSLVGEKAAPLFVCGQPGHESRRMTVGSIDYLVRCHAKSARMRPLGAHALRHTAATLAIEEGEPIHRVRDRLGHSSLLVTSKYLHCRQLLHDHSLPH